MATKKSGKSARTRASAKSSAKKAARKAPARAATKKAARKPARKRAAAKAAAADAAPKLTGPGVVHWEVQARDPGAQQRFFGDLFGWKVDAQNPMNYGMVTPAGSGSIGGGIGGTMDSPRATFYVQVTDINAALARAETMGGQTVMPRSDLGMIVMAQFRDPEGNVIGLVEGR